jgi:hypothetical protein
MPVGLKSNNLTNICKDKKWFHIIRKRKNVIYQ